MTNNEEYRELIIETINHIHNNLWLQRLFTIAHHMRTHEQVKEVDVQ